MSSTNGWNQNFLVNEVKMMEELEKLVAEEKRQTKERIERRTAQQLQSVYLKYLSNLSPFGPQSPSKSTSTSVSDWREKTESSVSPLHTDPYYVKSPAFLLCEPKQLDLNSNERICDKQFTESQEKFTISQAIQQQSVDNKSTRSSIERSTSPIDFPQTKSVQTDNQEFVSSENSLQVLNHLVNELKLLLNDSKRVNTVTPIEVQNDSNHKVRDYLTKSVQTVQILSEDKFTQSESYKNDKQFSDACCQSSVTSIDKILQTDPPQEEDTEIVIKMSDGFTQTDAQTDEDKSLISNSYELSIGEIPYFNHKSSFC
jgi:hypothetical protein